MNEEDLKVYVGINGYDILNRNKTRIVAFAKNKKDAKNIAKCVNFINHIQRHLKEMKITSHDGKVICKICGKTIDEIYEEETEK